MAKIEKYADLSRMYQKRYPCDESQVIYARWATPKDVAGKWLPWPGVRQATRFARGLETCDTIVRPEELIVGVRVGFQEHPKEKENWVSVNQPYADGITAHMAIDNTLLLKQGYQGIRKTLQTKLDELKRGTLASRAESLDEMDSKIPPQRFEQQDFLEAGLICIDAAIGFQQRYLEASKKLLSEVTDTDLRRIIEGQIKLLERVPREPARTFYEAVQSVYFTSVLTSFDSALMGLGRLDQELWEYYDRDIKEGRLTRERAVEILGAFFIKLSELWWVPMSLMVGGKTREGKSAVNELTYLMLEAADLVRLHNPSLGLAVDEDTPIDLLEHGARMVADGHCHPAFFNDRVITDGLIGYGVTPEDARWHLHCTCTEMTPSGCSGIWVVADYMNFGKVVENLLKEPGKIGSYDEFKTAVKRGLSELVRENNRVMNIYATTRKAQAAYPFLSLFVGDCLTKELDIERGGARYYYFYPQLVGLPTVVDSLMAVKTVVFEESRMSLGIFGKVVNENFKDAGELRDYIRNRLPKYGTNDAAADDLAMELIECYYREVGRYTNPYGFAFVPGFLSWIMHAEFGRNTGATPDGRLTGWALSDSLAASQGMARKGPTAMLETVEKFDLSKATGAVVVNVTIPVGKADEKIVKAIVYLVRGHFAKGGFELQFNVMSKEKLEAARKEPEKYRDLLVRVGGYSDYYVNLSEELQTEILRRFE
jgi:formate C-acetyltransferase